MPRAVRRQKVGREQGVADLEAIGLSLEGMALVGQARVRDGMRRLDEASAIATGEELQLPISLSWALCYVIAACEGVGDFPRAAQWCEVMSASAERWGAQHSRGVCRSAYGTVLACCGHWEAAEAELTAALADLEAARPGMAGGALVRLGELGARQGRVGGGARAVRTRRHADRLALLGLWRARARGRRRRGGRRRRRTRASGCCWRAASLTLMPRARTARARPRRARGARAAAAACTELGAAPADIGTPYVDGRAGSCGGTAAGAGAYQDARRAYEERSTTSPRRRPLRAARARLGLARALAALGRGERAAARPQAARDGFAALGAAREARPRRGAAPQRTVCGVSWGDSHAARTRGSATRCARPQQRRDRRAARAQPAHRAPAHGEHAHQVAPPLACGRRRLRRARRAALRRPMLAVSGQVGRMAGIGEGGAASMSLGSSASTNPEKGYSMSTILEAAEADHRRADRAGSSRPRFGLFDLAGIYLGQRLGLYGALSDGPAGEQRGSWRIAPAPTSATCANGSSSRP